MTFTQFLIGCAVTFVLLILAGVIDVLHRCTMPGRCLDLIPADKNLDIIGDGAWSVTPAEYPPAPPSALILDMPKRWEV